MYNELELETQSFFVFENGKSDFKVHLDNTYINIARNLFDFTVCI